MSLTHPAVRVAWTLFHRFYARRSFKGNRCAKHEVAAACVLLASKVCDTLRHLRDVVHAFAALQRKPGDERLRDKSPEFMELRKIVEDRERFLLHTLEFDVHIVHPQTFVKPIVKQVVIGVVKTHAVEALRLLGDSYMVKTVKPPSEEVKRSGDAEAIDRACYAPPLCLQYPPEQIACGAVLCAAMIHQTPLREKPGEGGKGKPWRAVLLKNCTEPNLRAIVLQLYGVNFNWRPPTPPERAYLDRMLPPSGAGGAGGAAVPPPSPKRRRLDGPSSAADWDGGAAAGANSSGGSGAAGAGSSGSGSGNAAAPPASGSAAAPLPAAPADASGAQQGT